MRQFILFILFATLTACSENIESEQVDSGVFIFVRAVDPADNTLKYGAFKFLEHEGNSKRTAFDWLFINSGNSVAKIETDDVILGKSSGSEEFGIKFSIFKINIAYADDTSWWIVSAPKSLKNNYSTEYCITNYQELGQLNHEDLSLCFN
ncbi:hypothetical protein [Pseudoalteromonas sp. T1lg122]|uniref:hypothetical protein n=1 Tax=Pseudoalteromonas sp. T1lg122 TaxID=2077094 RepID=UPI001319E5EB|nr:hypothetical protein [Pseudoalteromonas sp. T1lg122]